MTELDELIKSLQVPDGMRVKLAAAVAMRKAGQVCIGAQDFELAAQLRDAAIALLKS